MTPLPGASRLIDRFVECRRSAWIAWSREGAIIRRGWRRGSATRRAAGGMIRFDSRDGDAEGLSSPADLEMEIRAALGWVEAVSSRFLEAASRDAGARLSARIDLFRQAVLCERDGISASEERSGARLHLRVSHRDGTFLERRVAGRTMSSLAEREDGKAWGDALIHDLERGRGEAARPNGVFPVVFSSSGCGALVHEIGHFLGEDEPAESSVRKPGARIGDARLILQDDPLACPDARGAATIDDEGWPAMAVTLVEEGRVRDRLQSFRLGPGGGVSGNGHGRRASYRDLPRARMSCTFLEAGEDDPAAILASTPKGLFVRSLRGADIDASTGEVTMVIEEGNLIDRGRLTLPLRECLLSGNVGQILSRIDALGNDLIFDHGTGDCVQSDQQIPVVVGMPTLRTDRIRAISP